MALASEGVVLFVLTKVDAFITKHYDLLRNVGKDVEELKSELGYITYFLRTTDESKIEPWLDDIREEAYDIEDVLQDFALNLQKKAPGVPKLLNQHNIATRIKDIKNRLHGIRDRKNRYFGGSNNNNYGRSSSSQHRMSEEMEEDRLGTFLFT